MAFNRGALRKTTRFKSVDTRQNEMTQHHENGATDESGNVDRIREIIFGSQMRDYDSRFQKLEERLAREAGTSGVGKTSLIKRFVDQSFSEKYLTTVGVTIEKKIVELDNNSVSLVIWDLAGDDDFQRMQTSYLRGTSGYFLVADGTRRVTLDQALELQKRVSDQLGSAPFLLLLNKSDLTTQWEIDETRMTGLTNENFTVLKTSAREGAGVEDAFTTLAQRMLA